MLYLGGEKNYIKKSKNYYSKKQIVNSLNADSLFSHPLISNLRIIQEVG